MVELRTPVKQKPSSDYGQIIIYHVVEAEKVRISSITMYTNVELRINV